MVTYKCEYMYMYIITVNEKNLKRAMKDIWEDLEERKGRESN